MLLILWPAVVTNRVSLKYLFLSLVTLLISWQVKTYRGSDRYRPDVSTHDELPRPASSSYIIAANDYRKKEKKKNVCPLLDVTYKPVHAHYSHTYTYTLHVHVLQTNNRSHHIYVYITGTCRTRGEKERERDWKEKKNIQGESGHVSLDLPRNYLDDSIIQRQRTRIHPASLATRVLSYLYISDIAIEIIIIILIIYIIYIKKNMNKYIIYIIYIYIWCQEKKVWRRWEGWYFIEEI